MNEYFKNMPAIEFNEIIFKMIEIKDLIDNFNSRLVEKKIDLLESFLAKWNNQRNKSNDFQSYYDTAIESKIRFVKEKIDEMDSDIAQNNIKLLLIELLEIQINKVKDV